MSNTVLTSVPLDSQDDGDVVLAGRAQFPASNSENNTVDRRASSPNDHAGLNDRHPSKGVKRRPSTTPKGRASSAEGPLQSEHTKRARHNSFQKIAREGRSNEFSEELRTSWMDVRPTTGDDNARNGSISSTHGHVRRFTVDSYARPEELLADLLHQSRVYNTTAAARHQQTEPRRQSHESPSDRQVDLMPTLSQASDENVDWLSSSFGSDDRDRMVSMSDQSSSTPFWAEFQSSAHNFNSLTSPSEGESLDTADVPLPVVSEASRITQCTGSLPWTFSQAQQGQAAVKAVATVKKQPTSPSEQIVLPTSGVQGAIPSHVLNRMPVWQQKALNSLMTDDQDGHVASQNSDAFNTVLANIATSICHQSNAAAAAASALKDVHLPWSSTFTSSMVTNDEHNTTDFLSDHVEPASASTTSSTSSDGCARKAKATGKGDVQDKRNNSQDTTARSQQMQPQTRKANGGARGRTSKQVATQGSTEQLSKQDREQKRLADRRRRRRESHNAVERRRRDLINERIAELATLLPESVLIEAIAHSTSGGTAAHIDLAPFTRAAGNAMDGGSLVGVEDDDDVDDNPCGLTADSIAASKPNKGIILTKSVEYIKHLRDVCSSMRSTVFELQQQLDGVRRALSFNDGQMIVGQSLFNAKEAGSPSVQPNGANNRSRLHTGSESSHYHTSPHHSPTVLVPRISFSPPL